MEAGDPYIKEKLRLTKRVAHHPQGATLNAILKEIHGKGDFQTGGAEYQRARRFYNSKPQFFNVSKGPAGVLFVEPKLPLFDLIKRGITQNPREKASQEGLDFCRNLLGSIREINDKGRGLIQQNLEEYLERINDLRIVLEAEDPGTKPEYITLPYKTRFNDEGRIKKQHSILSSELEKSGEWYDQAVLLTLTTDPKKFSSLLDMWEEINTNFNRLMSWLSTESRLGYRPDYIKVLEATEKGYPHLHCLIFLEGEGGAMPYLEDKNEISRYWDKYQGRIVDLAPLVWEEDLPPEYDQSAGWVRWSADGDHGGDLGGGGGSGEGGGGGQTAGQYLGKYLSAIYGGIRGLNQPTALTDGGQDTEALEGPYQDKAAAWKIGMYWATRRKIRTESQDLRQAVEEEIEEEGDLAEEVAEIIRGGYRFVGAYAEHQLPGSIRRDSLQGETLFMDPWEEEPDPPPRSRAPPPPVTEEERLKKRYPSSMWGIIEEMARAE